MKNTTIKNVLLGIAIAIVATYLYPVVMFTLFSGPRGLLALFHVFPLYGLLYSSWIVIPLGAALGLMIPQMASGKSRWMAALQGAGIGAVAGLVSLFCFISAYGLGQGTSVLWTSIIVYCAVWVGVYAFIRAKSQSLYR